MFAESVKIGERINLEMFVGFQGKGLEMKDKQGCKECEHCSIGEVWEIFQGMKVDKGYEGGGNRKGFQNGGFDKIVAGVISILLKISPDKFSRLWQKDNRWPRVW